LDPFVVVEQVASQGRMAPVLVKRIKSKSKVLYGAVARVEKASGLRYPPYYVEPSLPIATTQAGYGEIGALYARVIPAENKGRLSIIVQFAAPLLLFGLKGTVEAVAAHEFTHYIHLVRRFSRMQVSSDERASTLFEAGYADEERVTAPALVLEGDKKLVGLVKKKFAAGLIDEKLNDKVAKGWLEKGLPTRRVSPEENVVSLSVELIAKASFDPMVIARIEELEGRGQSG
jgi:hypothetical protein